MKIAGGIIILLLVSCSGYLNNDSLSSENKEGVNKLYLSDSGGYLSDDVYNEITPFLYRQGAKAWLFFASDRNGSNYDIYCAEMNESDGTGTFFNLRALDANINTYGNEFSPVVFTTNGNTYISFIRQNESISNIETYLTSNDFKTSSLEAEMSSSSTTRIGLLKDQTVNVLQTVDGYSTTVTGYSFMSAGSSSSWGFYSSLFPSEPLKSINGYVKNEKEIYIVTRTNNQLAGMVYDRSNYMITVYKLPDYSSGNHDQDGFIDTATMKVYFASDRYGKGNFDLYRYNTLDFLKAQPELLPPVILSGYSFSTNSEFWSALTWTEVSGTSGYKIYRSTNTSSGYIDSSYQYIGTSVTTNYFDTNFGSLPVWRAAYKIKAYNNSSESDMSFWYEINGT